MPKSRAVRIVKSVFVVAITVISFLSIGLLTSGITPTAKATCLAGTCGPEDPIVTCANCVTYANICAANEACQYNCRVGEDGPPPCPQH